MKSGGIGRQELGPEFISGAVRGVATAFERTYFDPDIAKRMGDRLRMRLEEGAFAGATSLDSLAGALMLELLQVQEDPHISVSARPRCGETKQEPCSKRLYDAYARDNYGFRRVEVLPGTIGYLDLRVFCPVQLAGPTAAAAMNLLAATHALIFDLRHNGGGEDGMVRFLAGYLFEEPTELCSIHHRDARGVEQSRSADYVPGPRLAHLPAYVLTSHRTFSAAEDFTYNLQQRGRVVVVGEQTKGGGHTLEFVQLPEFGLELGIPEGEAVNPISKSSWEGVGVVPDLVVESAKALDVAYRHALERLKGTLTDPQDLFRVDWALASVRARLGDVTVDSEALASYVGSYGRNNLVRLQDGTLYVHHEGCPEAACTPLARDLFEYDGGTARVRFEADAGGVRQAVFLVEEGLTFTLRKT